MSISINRALTGKNIELFKEKSKASKGNMRDRKDTFKDLDF